MSSKITYRQQYTRCGKERCRKCKEGVGHGPYWYAYWSENGRTVSKYIGIRLPSNIEIEREGAGYARDRNAATLAARQYTNTDKVTLYATGIGSGNPDILPLQSDTQVLRIFVLGQFRVERWQSNEWSAPVNRTWHRRRARALLGCLLGNPGRRLGREQVMEALWPDLDMESAANRLNGAVHELRQILEPELARPAASRMLRLERDVLALADRTSIWVDADAFETLLNEAHSLEVRQGSESSLYQGNRAEKVEQLLEEAASLYRGDYLLEELYSEWAAPRREALRRSWIGLLLELAELREARGTLTSAMEPLNQLLATDPTDETAVQRLMLLLTRLDRRGEALNTYLRLVARLQRNYDSEPLPETRELYEKLRQGQFSKSPKLFTPAAHGDREVSRLEENQLQDTLTTSATLDALTQPPTHSLPVGEDKPAAPLVVTFAGIGQLGRYNQSPLIGRTRELESMRQILDSIEQASNYLQTPDTGLGTSAGGLRKADAKNSHLLLLMGETGIGKTRLAEELSHDAHTRGWAVAWTRAYEQEGAVPYRPWVELLRMLLKNISTGILVSSVGSRSHAESLASIHYTPTILERLSTLLPELRNLLPQNDRTYAHYSQLPPEQERLHQWEATLELLNILSKKTPLLLVLDDLHWMDESSRELLAYLTRHIQDQRILLLGTCRDVELAPGDTLLKLITDLRREQAIVTLPVQPLTQSQIGSLVAHLPQDIVHSIQTQAAGNPFFAEELARMSEALLSSSISSENQNSAAFSPFIGHNDEGGIDVSAVPPARGTLPEGIAAVLERRLGRLSSECQLLLGKAAVLGGSFEFNQLLFMSNELHEDTLLDLLEEALHAGLLTEEGSGTHITYHFWHPLIVSHLYGRLSAARCAQLHRRAANALMQTHEGNEGEVAAAITHHLMKGSGDSLQVAHYAELAGTQAYSLSAYIEAEQYYLQAIKTITQGKLPLREGVNESAPSKSATSFTDIPDPLHVARLLERVCECRMVQGNFEAARNGFECILALRISCQPFTSEAGQKYEAQIQALIWREIGHTWASNGDYEKAYECYKRGKLVMQDAGVTSGAAWACLHLQHGSIINLQGNYVEARRYVLEALEMLEQAIQARQAASPEWAASPPGFVDPSGPHIFQTRTEREILGDPLDVGRAHELLGLIATSVGQFTEALTHLYRALAIFEQHDLVIEMAKVCSNLGAVHAIKSENAMAYTYIHRSLELAERMSNLPIIALTTGNLGEMAARSGDLLKAEEWFRRSLAISERTNEREHQCWCNIALAIALQDQGNLQGAAEGIRRALAIARAMKSARNIGGALIALADLRVTQAIIAAKLQGNMRITHHSASACTRLLLHARSTIQRAIVLDGLETELVVEGKVLLANIYFLLGDLQAARQEAMRTMEEARRHELTRMLARSYRLLGRILAAQGEHEQAGACFEEALKIFRDHAMRLDYARALHGYGDTLLERSTPGSGVYQTGLAHLNEARTIFAACHAAIDLDWVDQSLTNTTSEILEI